MKIRYKIIIHSSIYIFGIITAVAIPILKCAHPAVMTYQNDWQAFWLGVGNADNKIKNFRNPNLFLNFNGNVQIKVDEKSSKGWLETDPNFTYFYKTDGSTSLTIDPQA